MHEFAFHLVKIMILIYFCLVLFYILSITVAFIFICPYFFTLKINTENPGRGLQMFGFYILEFFP